MHATSTIAWSDFQRIDLRVGTIVGAEPNRSARKAAYVLQVDLGDDLGVRTSSAQITDLYTPDSLIGRQVLCVCNFEPKRVAGIKSEVLITGAPRGDGKVVLAGFDHRIPNGTRLA